MGQFHFTPERYCEVMRAELPAYDELQDQVALATSGLEARTILDLGFGTGETARRVLARHPDAELVGIDASADMLAEAVAPGDLRVGRLEEALPHGPFDLVISALAVHHLDGVGKRDLFRRVGDVLRAGGRFVLGDVVLTDEQVTPLTPDFDLPDQLEDQLEWLRAAGFDPLVTWTWKDLAVIAAERGPG
jgi:tRNA (cmo5U34)-methyltransferase